MSYGQKGFESSLRSDDFMNGNGEYRTLVQALRFNRLFVVSRGIRSILFNLEARSV
jgi:hypothetical protein